MNRICLAVCCTLALVVCIGCTPPPPGPAPAAKVKGTANMDGKPIAAGELHFGRMGVPPRVIQIKDGTFAGQAPIGKNQVELYIYVDGPPSAKYPDTPTKKNIAPEKYWGPKTTLDATVNAAGANEFRFDVSSK